MGFRVMAMAMVATDHHQDCVNISTCTMVVAAVAVTVAAAIAVAVGDSSTRAELKVEVEVALAAAVAVGVAVSSVADDGYDVYYHDACYCHYYCFWFSTIGTTVIVIATCYLFFHDE